ncbi:ANL family adenylate-forming protein [Sanguibacteroides justesenii]|uniref:AMP-binding protein n=1 Tax=Sanguibacteroides justesenii TaxID=1547597 RepID=A0A0C3MJ32_9PORP|nr:fatty acid--CoA ligase family protein [Sanguibacteroides justesenii]KIO46688.1 AMP-binding protein [Sanguibacteroides justesenii]
MKSLFLVDRGIEYSYETLLTDINKAEVYFPYFQQNNIYVYFLNLILALVEDQPLTLIDADVNISEVEEDAVRLINQPVVLQPRCFKNIEEVLERVVRSGSEISIFTSGTTGQPKKIIHTLFSLTRTVRVAENYKGQIWGYAYNPTHMAGLQVFFQAFENLNTMVNIFNMSRLEIYHQIETKKITHISATPTFYRLLLPPEKNYPFVKRITLGGEKSDSKLYESILKIFPGAKINNIYASTEAGALFASKGEYFQIPMSIMDKIKIEKDELLIHKSLLGYSDYFVFAGEYYCTGDLIEWIDQESGTFRFKNRKNELINVGGYKVNPNEVEECILQIPDVLQVMVYGKANSVLGNILCAELKLIPGSQLTEIYIRSYLSKKLQDFKIPRRIKFVESISLTRTGKIKRR